MSQPEKVMIVTGASRGIGAAVARLAARRGYAVCVNYHRRRDAAGPAAGPHQFVRRELPPAVVAGQNAAGDRQPRHRRGGEAAAAEAARDP